MKKFIKFLKAKKTFLQSKDKIFNSRFFTVIYLQEFFKEKSRNFYIQDMKNLICLKF